MVLLHLNAKSGQVTLGEHGDGCNSSDARPSLQSIVPSQTSSMFKHWVLLAQANWPSGHGG